VSEVEEELSKNEVELSKKEDGSCETEEILGKEEKELHKMDAGNLTMHMICSSDLPWLWCTF
jgi:hypothetical protein